MASSSELQFQFGQIAAALHLVETEDSWQKIDGALNKLEQITKSGGYKNELFIPLFKEHSAPIVNSLLSERTRLSGSAADLVTSVAPRLANRFEALISTFIPPLLQLCARTNKVQLVRAKKCLLLIAKHCKLASLFPLLRDASKDKSITLRNVAVEVTLTLMESIENVEKIERRLGDIELIIKNTATDRDPEVRQWCKRVFELYIERFPDRVSEFTAAFTPTTKRYLAISNLEKQAGPSTLHSTTVQRKPLQRIQPAVQAPKKTFVEQVEEASVKMSNVRAVSTSSNKHLSGHTTTSTANKRQRDVSSASNSRSTSAQHNRSADMKPTSSRSVSSSSAKGRSQETNSAQIPALPSPEERERAILRAEVSRQSSATPSRGIAARLALEQFEMRVKAKNDNGTTSSSRAALTAFAVAASKKHSPRRLPVRIPLPPASTSKIVSNFVPESNHSNLMAQRIVKPTSRPCSPDVFDSKPMPKEATIQRTKVIVKAGLGNSNNMSNTKKASTLTKNMSAKGKLLGNTAIGHKSDISQRGGGVIRGVTKSSIPVASPRPKFFASPSAAVSSSKERKNEGLNDLEDFMEALTVNVEKPILQSVSPQVQPFSSTSPIKEEMENKRIKLNSSSSSSPSSNYHQINAAAIAAQSRPTSRKTPTRPAFIFGRMAPMVVAGKKI